jgi:hypothetical protein
MTKSRAKSVFQRELLQEDHSVQVQILPAVLVPGTSTTGRMPICVCKPYLPPAGWGSARSNMLPVVIITTLNIFPVYDFVFYFLFCFLFYLLYKNSDPQKSVVPAMRNSCI